MRLTSRHKIQLTSSRDYLLIYCLCGNEIKYVGSFNVQNGQLNTHFKHVPETSLEKDIPDICKESCGEPIFEDYDIALIKNLYTLGGKETVFKYLNEGK